MLYGTGRTDWANPPTFAIDPPSDGRFIVRVGEANHGILEIELDGETVARDDAFNVDREYFAHDVAVDVAAGPHRITLRNAGSDWLRIGHVLLTDYRDTSVHPDVDAFGLRSEAGVALWIRHRLNEWPYRALGFAPIEQLDIAVTVAGLPDGRYRVDWWDTSAGTMLRGEDVVSVDGEAVVRLAELATDIACVIHR